MLQTNLSLKRIIVSIYGSVQGVGFRPFVYRMAEYYQICGTIRNTSSGVEIDAQGDASSLALFIDALSKQKPERAHIIELTTREEPPLIVQDTFQILPSQEGSDVALALLADSALCVECMQELFDPSNRRYRYPFLHCMSCGPRFSLFCLMPFDRHHTTMADFTMCRECQTEYDDTKNRRFYSQTNCCPTCGPKLLLMSRDQIPQAKEYEAIEKAADALREGKIVALKNTGGYLLLVDATNEEAVKRLRERKRRPKKPFAVMVPDLFMARTLSSTSQVEEALLTSPAAPIVLLKAKEHIFPLAKSVSEDSPYIGVMLPHNAIHHLLLRLLKRPLVATSGNSSGRPICIREEEAFQELGSIADLFLVHNRRIMHRLDDSLVHVIDNQPVVLRSARGYVPLAIELPKNLPPLPPTFASGAHQKNTFAFAKDHRIYVSQHIGDLDLAPTCVAYEKEIESWSSLLHLSPQQYVCDKHPTYYSTQYFEKRNIDAYTIQHHKAHVYSGMVDCKLSFPFLAFSWDGTGYGDDKTLWGGEVFLAKESGLERFATLAPFLLAGGEAAVREPRRSALGLLYAIEGKNLISSCYRSWLEGAFSPYELDLLLTALDKKINAPLCSSMGRLFDAAGALLDCCHINVYEGHAPLCLESHASKTENTQARYTLCLLKHQGLWMIEWKEMVQAMMEDKKNGVDIGSIALGFHKALSEVILSLAQKVNFRDVLLTGGVMQNKLLSELTIHTLRQNGFSPHIHRTLAPNDGGIAAGQIMGLSCLQQQR